MILRKRIVFFPPRSTWQWLMSWSHYVACGRIWLMIWRNRALFWDPSCVNSTPSLKVSSFLKTISSLETKEKDYWTSVSHHRVNGVKRNRLSLAPERGLFYVDVCKNTYTFHRKPYWRVLAAGTNTLDQLVQELLDLQENYLYSQYDPLAIVRSSGKAAISVVISSTISIFWRRLRMKPSSLAHFWWNEAQTPLFTLLLASICTAYSDRSLFSKSVTITEWNPMSFSSWTRLIDGKPQITDWSTGAVPSKSRGLNLIKFHCDWTESRVKWWRTHFLITRNGWNHFNETCQASSP